MCKRKQQRPLSRVSHLLAVFRFAVRRQCVVLLLGKQDIRSKIKIVFKEKEFLAYDVVDARKMYSPSITLVLWDQV